MKSTVPWRGVTVILINADAVIIDMYRYLITVDLNVDINTICICMLIYIVQTFTQYTDQTDRDNFRNLDRSIRTVNVRFNDTFWISIFVSEMVSSNKVSIGTVASMSPVSPKRIAFRESSMDVVESMSSSSVTFARLTSDLISHDRESRVCLVRSNCSRISVCKDCTNLS